MQNPDVSVIVCTLNEEKRISACLRCLYDQDYTGVYEIIVADGCSEDRTVEIAERMGARIVLEKKRAIAAERQAGARAALGQFLLFTDADSMAPRGWISAVIHAFRTHPNAVIVYGPVLPSDARPLTSFLANLLLPAYFALLHWLRLDTPVGSSLAIRRDAFLAIDGFNTDLVTCEDIDLAKRCRHLGKLVYSRRVRMLVSQRRVTAWGTWKYVTFHLINGLRYHFTGRSSRDYGCVR